jgi:hypothetical protein
MCRRSPSLFLALGTRTAAKQLLEGVNTGSMSITPVDAQSVSTNELERYRPDVCRYPDRVQQRAAAHLLNAAGAGTGQAEGAGRKESGVTVLVPFDQETVVPAIDGVGDGGWQ